jgi:hypothetical protein
MVSLLSITAGWLDVPRLVDGHVSEFASFGCWSGEGAW